LTQFLDGAGGRPRTEGCVVADLVVPLDAKVRPQTVDLVVAVVALEVVGSNGSVDTAVGDLPRRNPPRLECLVASAELDVWHLSIDDKDRPRIVGALVALEYQCTQ